MARQLQSMKTDVNTGVRSDAQGIVDSTEITGLFNKRLRLLKMRGEFRGTKLSTPVDIFPGVYEYAAPTAYKALKLLRPTEGAMDIDMLTSNEWRDKLATTDNYIVSDEQYLESKVLLVRAGTDNAIITIEPFTAYNENGTATAIASTDTTNVRTVSGSRYKSNAAVAFDIDVSASGSNTAGIVKTLTTGVDISENEDIGTLFLDMLLPDGIASTLTSVALRWGSSDSAYWEKAITTCHNGQAFARGKNVLGFAWGSATETGTPDSNAIDYIRVLLTYSASQADANLIVLQDLRVANPTEFVVDYYSTRFTRSAAGVLQDEFSAEDDTSLLEDFEDDMLVEGVIADVNHLRVDNVGSARAEARFEEYYGQITNNKPSEKQRASQTYYEM
jgi:hypothetical protein